MPISGKRKTLDYQSALRDVAKSMVRLRRPDRLIKLITRFIDREFKLVHTSLLILDAVKKQYVFVNSKGSRRLPVGLVKFDVDHPLIRWFSDTKKRLPAQKDFLLLPQVRKMQSRAQFRMASNAKTEHLARIQKTMENLRAELIIPSYFKDTLIGILILGKKQKGGSFMPKEISFFQTLAQDCSMAVKTTEYHQNLFEKTQELEKRINEIETLRQKEQKTYYEIMRSLAQEVHAKEPSTFGHVEEVEKLGIMTARELGLDLSGRNKDILSAALTLHDVGKIGVPDHVLTKPGALTEEEWKIMRTHVEKGVRILEPLTDFKKVREIIWQHHERYDGKGYPRGMRGEEIAIEARIVSVVDAFHAIVSTRCYSQGRPVEEAFRELKNCAGTQFDPQVVEAFIRVLSREMQKKSSSLAPV